MGPLAPFAWTEERTVGRSRRPAAVEEEKQIPRGNDRKKSKSNRNGTSRRRSRFPEGMTERKARATATAKARATATAKARATATAKARATATAMARSGGMSSRLRAVCLLFGGVGPVQQLRDAFPQAGGADGFHQTLGEAGLGHLFGGDFWKCRSERQDGNTREGGNLA